MSLRTNKEDFSLNTKGRDQVFNKELLSLSTGPGGKQEPRGDGSGKETVGKKGMVDKIRRGSATSRHRKLTSQYSATVLRSQSNPQSTWQLSSQVCT